ncbi:hypothetical protein QTP88_006938 [Uroleucon formosanum]
MGLLPAKQNQNNIALENMNYCIKKGPSFFQNKQKSYTQSARISDHKRHLTPAMFERTLPNAFSKNCGNPFVENGFDQWKKFEKISYHENSMYHREANTTWLLRENSLNSVNQQICKQISTETQYWIDVLKRVVAVIKYLSSRGLPFRGDNEVFGVKNNGNFLGLLELNF